MWTIQLILSAYNSRRARSSQARVLQRGRPDSRSVPQHLGSPDPTQGMGPSLPPRSSVASGFWFKARLSGKAVLGPQEQAADGGRSEFLTMEEPVETWVGKQCGEGLPSSQLLASYLERWVLQPLEPGGFPPTGHCPPALVLAWHVCSYMSSIQLGRQLKLPL